jgi:alkanesulfonate monooxygenase SsuD/methylene tetrahydromethanopterin reductase-like flavin-dependent oxidoreductase (luciferase family)
MTHFGYTMMCEQTSPKQLVADVQAAEQAGFDLAVISDHYFPWVDAMGHSPYPWSVLGAAAQATARIGLMTAWHRDGRLASRSPARLFSARFRILGAQVAVFAHFWHREQGFAPRSAERPAQPGWDGW